MRLRARASARFGAQRILAAAALAACGAASFAGTAAAQLDPNGGPILIDADVNTINDADKRIDYKGNVLVQQGPSKLEADDVRVFFTAGPDGSAWGDIRRIEATGDVLVATAEQSARGDRAVYDLAEEKIIVSGDVVIAANNREAVSTGERWEVNLKDGTSRLTSAGGESGRVRTVLIPPARSEEAEPAADQDDS